MKVRGSMLTLCLCLVSASVALGQTQKIQDSVQRGLEQQRAAGLHRQAMYEDIEVMRRLLNRALAGLSSPGSTSSKTPQDAFDQRMGAGILNPTVLGGTSSAMINTNLQTATLYDYSQSMLPASNGVAAHDTQWQRSSALRPGGAEGAYLPGQGVVFMVTLPQQRVWHEPRTGKLTSLIACSKCHGDTKSLQPFVVQEGAPAQPLSAWEQMQHEVRGVKADPKLKQGTAQTQARTICGPGAVSEALVKVLAENGRHLTMLGENENLTVIVTFREASAPRYTIYSYLPDGATVGPLVPTAAQPSVGSGAGQALPADPAATRSSRAARTVEEVSETLKEGATTARDYELLGDLHAKQRRFEAAVEAYHKAIERAQGDDQARALKKKLIELIDEMIAARWADPVDAKQDVSKELLKKAIEYYSKAAEQQKAAAAKPSPALPEKLILSAPKKLLDQVGSGKISMEEFKKGVTVEHFKQ